MDCEVEKDSYDLMRKDIQDLAEICKITNQLLMEGNQQLSCIKDVIVDTQINIQQSNVQLTKIEKTVNKSKLKTFTMGFLTVASISLLTGGLSLIPTVGVSLIGGTLTNIIL